MATSHSNLGASAASRWMDCTASPTLIETMPTGLSSSSIFAEEGSAAHFLAETMTLQMLKARRKAGIHPLSVDWKGVLIAKPADLTLEQWNDEEDYAFYGGEDGLLLIDGGKIAAGVVDPIGFAHPTNQFWVTEEMEEACFMYVRTIEAQIEAAVSPDVRVEVCTYPLLDNSSVYGTADCIVTDKVGGQVWVSDFKYGKGVKVTAPHNAQAMFYAAGALMNEVRGGHTWDDSDRVNVVIIQPRIEFNDGTSISEWRTTAGEILTWRDEELQAKVDATQDDDQKEYIAGSYCRWCAAAPLCPLLQSTALKTAQEVFADDLPALTYSDAKSVELILPNATDDFGLASAMKIAAVLENWTKKVRELADYRQRNGGKLPGFKMVRKRTNRRWVDEDAAMQLVRTVCGGDPEDQEKAFVKKLKSPTQLEKAGFDKDAVAALTEKPEGGLTLVPDTDQRKEAATAISAFDDGFEN